MAASEHYRPNGDLAQGYYCGRCGAPGVNMYGTGHGDGLCEPNPQLVAELTRANSVTRGPVVRAFTPAEEQRGRTTPALVSGTGQIIRDLVVVIELFRGQNWNLDAAGPDVSAEIKRRATAALDRAKAAGQ